MEVAQQVTAESHREGHGTQWLINSGVKNVSDFGCRLANMLDEWQQGIYHIEKAVRNKKVDWSSDRYIVITMGRTLSTFDNDLLTTLVFHAHEHRIRVEIDGAANGYLRIAFSPRKESGSMYERHPGLLEAVGAWTGLKL